MRAFRSEVGRRAARSVQRIGGATLLSAGLALGAVEAGAQSSRDDSLIGGGKTLSCRDVELGSRRVQIAGGQDARVEDFPFIAQVQVGRGLCGGSLFAPGFVLTAAHCVMPIPGSRDCVTAGPGKCELADPSTIRVVLPGPSGTAVGDAAGATKVLAHPNFRYPTGADDRGALDADVAIIRLDRVFDVPDGAYVNIADPRIDANFAKGGECARVAGWGLTDVLNNRLREDPDRGKPSTDRLQSLNLALVDQKSMRAAQISRADQQKHALRRRRHSRASTPAKAIAAGRWWWMWAGRSRWAWSVGPMAARSRSITLCSRASARARFGDGSMRRCLGRAERRRRGGWRIGALAAALIAGLSASLPAEPARAADCTHGGCLNLAPLAAGEGVTFGDIVRRAERFFGVRANAYLVGALEAQATLPYMLPRQEPFVTAHQIHIPELYHFRVNQVFKDRTLLVWHFIIGHEMAHVYQEESKLLEAMSGPFRSVLIAELHADFLAGYFLAKELKISQADLDTLSEKLAQLPSGEKGSPDYHGSTGERYWATTQGSLAAYRRPPLSLGQASSEGVQCAFDLSVGGVQASGGMPCL